MTFHTLFKLHQPDLKVSRWEDGRFVTECIVCGALMEKRHAADWALSKR